MSAAESNCCLLVSTLDGSLPKVNITMPRVPASMLAPAVSMIPPSCRRRVIVRVVFSNSALRLLLVLSETIPITDSRTSMATHDTVSFLPIVQEEFIGTGSIQARALGRAGGQRQWRKCQSNAHLSYRRQCASPI